MPPKQSSISEANIKYVSAKRISIIILSWNTKELLRQCLESIYEDIGGYKIDINRYKFEIIVVDNGSSDGSVEYLKAQSAERKTTAQKLKLKIIQNERNLGFAKGNNQGIKAAKGKHIMFFNSDTIAKKGALKRLTEHLDKNPGVGAVSPLVLNQDGSIQKDPCYLKFPSPLLTFFYYNKILRRLALNFFPQILFSAAGFEKSIEVDQLPGAALMARKNVLDKIGGFDEDYKLYFEDTDLSWRIRKLGWKLMVVPQAKIIHLGRKSIEPVIKKTGIEKLYFLNFSSLFLFCRKHYPSWKSTLIRVIVLLHLASTFKFRLILKLIKNLWP